MFDRLMTRRMGLGFGLASLGCAPPPGLATPTPAEICAPPARGSIQVAVVRPRNDRGQLRCALFATPDGFPNDADAATHRVSHRVAAPGTCCEFPAVAPGRYAVAVLHDEDADGSLSTSAVGIPKEGFGASNDAAPRGMAPPAFADAAFDHGSTTTMTATLQYFGRAKRRPVAAAAKPPRDCTRPQYAMTGFDGPGWDRAKASPKRTAARVVVHATRLQLRTETSAHARFAELTAAMAEALWAHEGLIGFDVGVDEVCLSATTVGVWRDEASMRAFVQSEAHRAAMRAFGEVATGGKSAHWTAPTTAVPPDASEVRRRLDRGRTAVGRPAQ